MSLPPFFAPIVCTKSLQRNTWQGRAWPAPVDDHFELRGITGIDRACLVIVASGLHQRSMSNHWVLLNPITVVYSNQDTDRVLPEVVHIRCCATEPQPQTTDNR